MTVSVQALWRHPVKGLGCEQLDMAELRAGQPMPLDRAWALLHMAAPDTEDWQPRKNYLVVANGPRLAQIGAEALPDGCLRLTHPDLSTLTFDPDSDGPALANWARTIWPENQPEPGRLVHAPAQGMADNGAAQVSVMSLASLRALSQRVRQDLDPRRFRGNIWLDGLAPWEEFDLIGKTITIGDVQLDITDPIERCRATEANPDTGLRDAQPVRALHQAYGHRDFGVYATVKSDGRIAVGQQVTI